MTWENKPSDFMKTVIDDCETHVKKIIAIGLQAVVVSSPVMDGAYRGNHRLSINGETYDFDPKKQDLSGGATISEGMALIAHFRLGDTLYIQNNAPYSLRLENGWSDQAPKGIYTIAFQNMSSF